MKSTAIPLAPDKCGPAVHSLRPSLSVANIPEIKTNIPTGDKIEYCTLSEDKIEYLKNPKDTSSTHKIEYSEIKNS